jgi:putative transposase
VPWKESNAVTERMKFITRYLDGEKVTDLSQEFGISRKTGHKIINRFLDDGPGGLLDRLRSPRRVANKTPEIIEDMIISLKREKPTWGAAKIREIFLRKYPNHYCPCKATFHSILDKHGFTKTQKRHRRYKAKGTYLSVASKPNDLWCADFKGQFKMSNKQYCYPLTITDNYSRYLFSCEALENVKSNTSFNVFERIFKEHGLPTAIRTDNGVPFSYPQAMFGLSHLSVWWLRLGIKLERITPGCPEQNGRHERMHKTLKSWMGKARSNIFTQQECFDDFISEYNNERPHESLDMRTPSEIHLKSERTYKRASDPLDYPHSDVTVRVNDSGDLHHKGQRIYVSRSFAGEHLGVTEVDGYIPST